MGPHIAVLSELSYENVGVLNYGYEVLYY